jgi:hypothetical protein
MNNLIDDKIPRSGVDQIAGVGRLAYLQVIGIDADRVHVQQARIAAVVRYDNAGRGSLLFMPPPENLWVI